MPLARPAEAGREIYSLPPRPRVGRPMLFALALVIALDALLIRNFWPYALAITAIYVVGFIVWRRVSRRQPHLAAVCENGLVVETNGAPEWVDWRELNSVVYFETFGGSHYDVNAKGASYRLRQSTLGDTQLQDIIGLIIIRTRFEWINENLATRPEVLERYRPTRLDPKD